MKRKRRKKRENKLPGLRFCFPVKKMKGKKVKKKVYPTFELFPNTVYPVSKTDVSIIYVDLKK